MSATLIDANERTGARSRLPGNAAAVFYIGSPRLASCLSRFVMDLFTLVWSFLLFVAFIAFVAILAIDLYRFYTVPHYSLFSPTFFNPPSTNATRLPHYYDDVQTIILQQPEVPPSLMDVSPRILYHRRSDPPQLLGTGSIFMVEGRYDHIKRVFQVEDRRHVFLLGSGRLLSVCKSQCLSMSTELQRLSPRSIRIGPSGMFSSFCRLM